jgi:diguanylate cyclase (GGDEF)-like protein/putative nucleotidyltransferase with HDIG domain
LGQQSVATKGAAGSPAVQEVHEQQAMDLATAVVLRLRQQGIAGLPRNYELFYEAACGTSPDLVQALNALGARPRQTELDDIARRFLGGDGGAAVDAAHDTISGKLDEILSLLRKERSSMEAYGQILGETSTGLGNRATMSKEFLEKIVSVMATATRTSIENRNQLVTSVTTKTTELQEVRSKLEEYKKLADTDALTQLANRRAFDRQLTRIYDSNRGVAFGALVLADIDRFKQVNDRFGHQVGDRVLTHAARVFAEQTRAGELVARVGGEEFAMILPEADGEEAYQAAERVRQAISGTPFPDVGRMTMSAGVCDLRDAGDAETLYALADGALYWAKHNGRDMVLRHSPDAPQARPEARATGEPDGAGRGSLVSVRLLARVIDAKHASTRRHSERVAALAGELAAELGWSPARVAELREAALLHDVGKIGVPEGLLTAPRALTPDEVGRMREHVDMGGRILSEALSAEQLSWVRGHHERWDGDGYPDGLRAEECPEGARILALAEAWDVMTSERPYAPMPRTHPDALAECRALSGTQFWPPAVEALARIRGGG